MLQPKISTPAFRSSAASPMSSDQERYQPLPGDWLIGIADVADSTKAVQAKRYKAVNMAGAAVIVAMTNALGASRFPVRVRRRRRELRGAASAAGDCARRARRDRSLGQGRARPHAADRTGAGRGGARAGRRRARRALCRVRQRGAGDVLRRRARLGRCRDEAGRVRRARRAARHAARPQRPVVPVRRNPGDARPDPVAAGHAGGRTPSRTTFRAVVEAIIRLTERNPDASGPVPQELPRLGWPPQGLDLEARAQRRTGEPLAWRKVKVLVWTLLGFLIMRFNIKVGASRRRNTPGRWSRTPTSANSTTRCAW